MREIFKDLKIFDIDPYRLRSRNFYRDMISDRHILLRKLSNLRKPDKDFMCPLCHSKRKEFYLAYRSYKLFECARCGAVAPNIDYDKLAAVDFHSTKIIARDLKREIVSTFEYRKKTFAPERVEYLRNAISGFDSAGHYVLDFGCGPGYFLAHLKDTGIRARGLEANPNCVSFGRSLGLDIHDGRLSDEPDLAYTLITMFDVLEHLSNPVELFSQAHAKLKRRGCILLYTPNIHSLSTYLMSGSHNMLAVFNHLCFYDERSLKYLASETGFKIRRIDHYGLDIIDYLGMKEAQDGVAYVKRLKPMVDVVQALVDKAGVSNSMRVVLQKI